MRAHQSRFDKIKAQWDILKMKAAYIAAEREIISQAEIGNDLTGFDSAVQVFGPMTPKEFAEFEVDGFGNAKKYSVADDILAKAKEVRKKLDDAIHADDYVKAQMYQQILDGLEIKYNKYKDE